MPGFIGFVPMFLTLLFCFYHAYVAVVQRQSDVASAQLRRHQTDRCGRHLAGWGAAVRVDVSGHSISRHCDVELYLYMCRIALCFVICNIMMCLLLRLLNV